VRDVVEVLPTLLGRPESYGQIYNVGNNEEVSIVQLAERVKEATGGKSEIAFVPYEEAYVEGFEDMRRRVPDLTKINEAVGYVPKRNLDTILQDVIADQKQPGAEG